MLAALPVAVALLALLIGKLQTPQRSASPGPADHMRPDDDGWTAERLAAHDELLLAVGGVVFDVSEAPHLYGTDGPYTTLTNKPVSRALALGTLEADEIARGDDVADLNPRQLQELEDRVRFFGKYPIVGRLREPVLGTRGASGQLAVHHMSGHRMPRAS